MARERSELEAKESLAQAQIAKLQQQLQELQFREAAERRRSKQLESKVCELELAVRNKDLQLAEFQSVTEKKAMRPTGLGEVNETAKERPHWGEQNGSNASGMPSEGSSASTLSKMDPSDDVLNFPEESVLRSQCADVEVACGQLLNKASTPASDMDTQSGAPDVASEPEATESSRFIQLIRLQDGSAENGSEFLPTELFPLLLDFLPVDEVVRFDVRAVSRFFASPKAWVFHLFKLMDIDSLPTWSSEKQMHPVVECFRKCVQAHNEEPAILERRGRLTREYLLGTSERCRGFLLWMHKLYRWQLYQPALVHHFIGVCLDDLEPPASRHRFCIAYIRGLNCDCASPVASWTLRALQRSKKLFARH